MNEKLIVRAAIKRSGKTQPELSRQVGLATKTVGAMLCRPNDLALGNFYKLLSALGFEIVIRPKNRADKTEWILREEDEPIETVAFVSDERKEMISAKEMETEQEMAQLKRMMRK
jgi:hypothetical protein